METTGNEMDVQKEALWRERLAARAASGASIAQWCREQGYSESLFHHWKNVIARRDGLYAPPQRKVVVQAESVPVFARVKWAAAKGHGAAEKEAAGVEIVLVCGAKLRLGVGFDAATLLRAVAALEGQPC